jgi:hypothetical protein
METQQIYSPLPQRTSIRLLKIAAWHSSDRIECELIVVDDLANPPMFEALSYAWGDPNMTVPIYCNSVLKVITTNLAAALSNFRRSSISGAPKDLSSVKFILQSWVKFPQKPIPKLPSFAKRIKLDESMLSSAEGLIWIDAICINRDDVAEKSFQVALMPAIYQAATRVIVWLGDGSSDVEPGLRILSISLNCYHAERPPDRERYSPQRENIFFDRHRARGCPELDDPCWLSLHRFLSRPWFSQAWVIQEVAMSQSCIMIVGDLELDWKAIGRATY